MLHKYLLRYAIIFISFFVFANNYTLAQENKAWGCDSAQSPIRVNGEWTDVVVFSDTTIYWTDASGNTMTNYTNFVVHKSSIKWSSELWSEPDTLYVCNYEGTTWSRFNIPFSVSEIGSGQLYTYKFDSVYFPIGDGNCHAYNFAKIYLKPTPNDTIYDTLAQCLPNNVSTYSWRGQTVPDSILQPANAIASGIYHKDLIAGEKCSTFYLPLTLIGHNDTIPTIDTACDYYMWHDESSLPLHSLITFQDSTPSYTYDAVYLERDSMNSTQEFGTGVFVQPFKCSKIYTLDLNLHNTRSRDTVVSVCDSFTWNRTNVKYTESIQLREYTSGRGYVTYDSLREDNSRRCVDSLFLILEVARDSHFVDSLAACDHYYWYADSTTYTQTDMSGNIRDTHYIYNISPSNDTLSVCRNYFQLFIQIFPDSSVVDTVFACNYYLWPDDTTNTVRTSDITDSSVMKYRSAQYGPHTDPGFAGTPYAYGVFTCPMNRYLYLIVDSNSLTDDPGFAGCDSVALARVLDTSIYTTNPVGKQNDIRRDAFTTYTFYDDTTILVHYPTCRVGCDSAVSITLEVGHGSPDTTFTNAACPSCPTGYLIDSLCDGFDWLIPDGTYNNITGLYEDTTVRLTTSGIHYYAVRNSRGCDSMLARHVYIRPNTMIEDGSDTACFQYTWNPNAPSPETFYRDTNLIDSIHRGHGECDTIYYWHLYVWQHRDSTLDTSVCDSFLWYSMHSTVHDSLYRYSGVTTVNSVKDVNGCDSSLTLNLTVRYSTSELRPDTNSCYPFRWDSTGLSYGVKADTLVRDTGFYLLQGIKNVKGCDSAWYLPINIYPVYDVRDTLVACDDYLDTIASTSAKHRTSTQTTDWKLRTGAPIDRSWYGADGYGCDSVIHMHIIVNYSDTSNSIVQTACETYTWLGRTFTRDTIISKRTVDYDGNPLKTVQGCDSACSLRLTVKPNGYENLYIDACDEFKWNMNSHIYNILYDTTAVSPLTIDTIDAFIDTVTTRGILRNGCDSITILHLTLAPTIYRDTTVIACDRYTWNGTTYTTNMNAMQRHDSAAYNGCDSVERLFLTINKASRSTVTSYNEYCDHYSWTGHRNASGSIITFYTDTVYTDTLRYQNYLDCDSIVTLRLRLNYSDTFVVYDTACDSFLWIDNNMYHHSTDSLPILPTYAAGSLSTGCDSVLRLSLHLHYSHYMGRYDVTACDSFLWNLNNVVYFESYATAIATGHSTVQGYLVDTLHTVQGCDSSVVLHLSVNHSTADTTDTTAAVCGQFTWYDTTLYQASEDVNTLDTVVLALRNAEGCDSNMRLFLTLYPNRYDRQILGRRLNSDGVTYAPAICDSIFWYDTLITTTGIYTDTVHLSTGCDSVYLLDVIIGHATSSVSDVFLCDGPYFWHDSSYLHSTDSAFYIPSTKNTQGCDTTAFLNLTINADIRYVDSVTACDNYYWNSRVIDTSVTNFSISQRFYSVLGCDSTSYLYLIIHKSIAETDTATACDSYFWPYDGMTYTSTRQVDYPLTEKTVDGCDSARRLLLTINYSSHDTIFETACEQYTWHGRTTRTPVDGRTNTIWQFHEANGNIFGCDTTAYLVLSIDTNSRGRFDTAYCNSLTWNGKTHFTSVYYDETWVLPEGEAFYDTVFGVAENGCDSIYQLSATLRGSHMATDTVSACDRFLWRNRVTYTPVSGTYPSPTNPVLFTNTIATYTVPHANPSNDCDSIYTLHLSLYKSTHNLESYNPCDSIVWHATSYRVPGRYVYRYTDSNNCASADTMILTLRRSSVTRQDLGQVCNDVLWCDSIYTASTDTDFRVYTNVAGCDSTDFLSVVVNHADVTDTLFHIGCDSVVFEGITYFSDTVIDRNPGTSNADGCLDIVRNYIVVYPTYDSLLTVATCDTFSWRGTLFDSSAYGVRDVLMSQDGCDSVFTLDLTISYGVFDTLDSVSHCDSYTWMGIYDSDPRTFTSSTLARSVFGHTPDGCDSAVVLDITIYHSAHIDTFINACDTFTWIENGNYIWGTSVTDTFTWRASDNYLGCDSHITVHVTILRSPDTSFALTVCDSVRWNDSLYTLSDEYTQRFSAAAANGCDSIATMRLLVHQSPVERYDITECDAYRWVETGQTYIYSTTERVVKGVDANGCDSLAILNLSLRYAKTKDVFQHACDSFPWHGSVFRSSGLYSYTDFRGFEGGCDSTTHMRLTVDRTTRHYESVTSCDRYLWYGTTYTAGGQYTYLQTTPNVNGCDSISILYLTLFSNDTILHDTVACDSLSWYGTTYRWSQSGITNRTTNADGCYTFDILNLRMGFSTTYDAPAASVCDSFVWHDQVYRSTGRISFDTLTSLGCDSTIRMNLTIRQGYVATEDAGDKCGSYTWHGVTYTASTDSAVYRAPSIVTGGCDTVITLRVAIRHVGPYYDTIAACTSYTWQDLQLTSDTILVSIDNSVYGCDSTVVSFIHIAQRTTTRLDTTLCDGLNWLGETYSQSGVYTLRKPTDVQGCDSVFVINLIVKGNSVTLSDFYTACPGYEWYGIRFYASADTLVHLGTTSLGCDSSARLRFESIGTFRYTDTTYVACDAFTYGGVTYTSDTDFLASFPMTYACDSFSLMHIRIVASPSATDEIEACDSYIWRDGVTYTASTTSPVFTTPSGSLCDSVYRLNLALGHSVTSAFNQIASDYYQWDDTLIRTSGTYTRAFSTVDGCDSVVTLTLVVTGLPLPQILCNDSRLLMVNHYPDGSNGARVDYFAYRWYRNGTIIPGASLDYYSQNGYSTLSGCYYVEVAVDASLTHWVASEPFCIGTYGIDDVAAELPQLSIYPNPLRRGAPLTLQVSLPEGYAMDEAVIEVFDLQGRVAYTAPLVSLVSTLTLDLPSGIYTLRLRTAAATSAAHKLIIK